MPLPPLPLVDGRLFIDHSHWIEPLSTCNRYHQYQALHKRIPAAEAPALNFGTAQHMARELRYRRYGTEPVDATYYDLVAGMFAEFFDQHPVPEGDFRTLNWAIEVSRQYDQHYLNEGLTLFEYDTPQPCTHCTPETQSKCFWCASTGLSSVMVELSFVVPLFTWVGQLPAWAGIAPDDDGLHRVPVDYTGRIDLPYWDGGKIWIRDTKTTSMLGDVFWTRMRMTPQMRGYAWAFEKLTDQPVAGYQIDAIRTKEPPQYVLNNEVSKRGKAQSPEAWWQESLARQRFWLQPYELEAWYATTLELIHEFFWHYVRGFMPMKTAWCSQYGKCQYLDVCTLAPGDRDMILASGQFKTNDWSPLQKV